jgi:CRISPR-associated protein Csb2
VLSDAPLKATHGILLADEVHRQVARKLPAGSAGALFGRDGASTDHQHAHWIPLPSTPAAGATVTSLVIWAPQGLNPAEVAALTSTRGASGRRGRRRNGSNAGTAAGTVSDEGYEVSGFPPVELLLQAAGPIETVAPELCQPARRWRSLTPYIPVRHQKRQSLDDFLAEDIAAELRYRGLPAATASRVHPDEGLSDRWALPFRRYRMTETLAKARRGLGVRLQVPADAQAPAGPILLGQLSHFGYGIFVPDTE